MADGRGDVGVLPTIGPLGEYVATMGRGVTRSLAIILIGKIEAISAGPELTKARTRRVSSQREERARHKDERRERPGSG